MKKSKHDIDPTQMSRTVTRVKRIVKTSDCNPTLLPYFGYLKMETARFFNPGFFSSCDFKIST